MEINNRENKNNDNIQKDRVIFFDKNSVSGPLNKHSKLIEHLAENDPEQPGK
jgi:hypothetical protein